MKFLLNIQNSPVRYSKFCGSIFVIAYFPMAPSMLYLPEPIKKMLKNPAR